MTKYILHGGNTGERNADNNSFFEQMTEGLNGKVKVLLNYFSRPKEDWEKLAEEDRRRFSNAETSFEIANENEIEKQIKAADVMYMRGGDCETLVEKMVKVKNLDSLIEGKVIAGSSAGVYVLSKYYWCNDNMKVMGGLGILNLKSFCHWEEKDKEIVKQLVKTGGEIPLLTLPSQKWVVLWK